ncbi:MAG: 30S ribosomal protein S1 [Anaerolineales bacterium]
MDQNELPNTIEQVNASGAQSQTAATMTMEELLNQSEAQLDQPRPGDVRTGVIASITNDEIMVSIGAKSEGVIPARELEQMSAEERDKLRVGEEIQVYIISPDTQKGTMLLSHTRSKEDDDWAQAEALMKSKEAYTGQVEGFNKGGLIVRVGRLRGFVPASQASQARRMRYQGDTPEQRWEHMEGETLVGRVIEVDRERRRLILSERAANLDSRDAMKDRLLSEIHVGDVRKGRVTSLADFGAFVNINGADGLVHLSELSWERVDHPSKLLSVGDEVEVKVINVDQERKRIGLSLRQLQQDPWEDRVASFKVGQLVEGTITRLVKFGAFARIDEHTEGLVHISEMSERHIEHPKEILREGETLPLRIIKIEPERRRIGLSIRKVDSAQYSDQDYEAAMAAAGELPTGEAQAADKPEEPAAESAQEISSDENEPEPVQLEESN